MMRVAWLLAILLAAASLAEVAEAQAKRKKRPKMRDRGAPQAQPLQPGRAPQQAMGYLSVVRVDRANELVVINGGTSHGLRAEALVCFLNDYRETLTCERIESVARASAIVRIRTKPINLFKPGLPVRPATAQEVAVYGPQTSGGYGPFIHVG